MKPEQRAAGGCDAEGGPGAGKISCDGVAGSSLLPHIQHRAKQISHQKRMFWLNSAKTPSMSLRKRQFRLWLLHPQPLQHPHGAGFLPCR